MFNVEAEDIHLASKVILQRQFFEAIVRSASVKFSNRGDLPTLSEKLDHLFSTKLVENATKNKAKSVEEEKSFKIAEKVFEELEKPLKEVFVHFSKRKSSSFGIEDITLEVDEIINLFKKAEILDGVNLKLEDLLGSVEKYYSPETRLESKLQD